MKIDLHLHTKYSRDSLLKLSTLKKIMSKKNITPIITDHNEIKAHKQIKCPCIGEEIKTTQGDLIALFIQEKIKPNLTITETIEKIKQQDGIIILPHGFDRLRSETLLGYKLTKKQLKKIDAIEIFNSRTLQSKYNREANKFANLNKKLKTVGSDSHTKFELGNAYINIKPFNSKKEFLTNLKKATFYTKSSPFWVHAITKYVKIKKNHSWK